jgi:hypothetical protein
MSRSTVPHDEHVLHVLDTDSWHSPLKIRLAMKRAGLRSVSLGSFFKSLDRLVQQKRIVERQRNLTRQEKKDRGGHPAKEYQRARVAA